MAADANADSAQDGFGVVEIVAGGAAASRTHHRDGLCSRDARAKVDDRHLHTQSGHHMVDVTFILS
jgi:hypothetical protein